jgi:hypothetical protein
VCLLVAMATLGPVLTSCGGSNSPAVTSPTASTDVSGHWVGLAPDGLVFAPGSGLCSFDLTLDLTQSGGVVGGTAATQVRSAVTPSCTSQSLSSVDRATAQTLPSRLTGTAGAGAVSFNVIVATFTNGVPTTFSAIVASGTFTASRLTMSGTNLPARTWNDSFYPVGDSRRGNLVPDCVLNDPTANGECGATSNLNGSQALSLTATR